MTRPGVGRSGLPHPGQNPDIRLIVWQEGQATVLRGIKGWARRLGPVHALAVLVLLQLWLIAAHSPWRDELQAYLLVRDSPGLSGLFANLHYEGHPGVWYLVLALVRIAVGSARALTAAQVVIALGTTALVWRRAPFADWLKLLILAGYYPLFEYGVIARSYGLGALLLFAWLALRRGGWGWLILAVMANIAVNFALLSAFCVAAGLWIERRWSWAGAALWAAGCLAAVITIIPAHDVQTGLSALAQPLAARVLAALRWQSAALYPAMVGVWPYRWQVLVSPPEAPWPAAMLGLAAGGLIALAVRREPKASVLTLGLFLVLAALSALIYPTYPRHVGVLVLFGVGLEWIRTEARDEPASPLFVAWTGLLAACGLWAAVCALAIPFSAGRQEARWIADHHLERAAWAAYPGYAGSDISAYFDRPTYNLQKQCLDTFIRWNAHAYDDVDDDVLADRIEDPGPFDYLVSDEDLGPLDDPMHLVAHFDRGSGDNDLFIYAMDRPKAGAALACR